MKLGNFAGKEVGWLKDGEKNDSCIISSRIRLARNLKNYPFPNAASGEQLNKILEEVFHVADKITFLKKAAKIRLDECSDIDRRMLLERHLISHEQAIAAVNGGVIIDDREQISIMVNEEDHLRIQYITAGQNLMEAWDVINRLDDEISRNAEYAYSDKWGYLTACPTNTGTGMRASCQMHLPALGMTNGLRTTMESINRLGMVVRGLYGEGTKIMGDILQISNQVTLGISEQRIADSLKRLVVQVVERENKVREKLIQSEEQSLKDRVFRSMGILSNAYRISFTEALDLISNIRIGIYCGLIEMDINKLNNLMIKIQPAHIQEIENKKMDSAERDVKRAEFIKNTLN